MNIAMEQTEVRARDAHGNRGEGAFKGGLCHGADRGACHGDRGEGAFRGGHLGV